MLAFLLSLCLVVVPPPPPTVVALPSIVSVAPWGNDSVALFHVDGGLTVASLFGLVIMDATPNAFGWPTIGNDSSNTGGAGPHVFTTSYTSNSGSHTITTPCTGYNSVTDCANRHRAAVEALQLVYPRL